MKCNPDCGYSEGSAKDCSASLLTFVAKKRTPLTTISGNKVVCDAHANAWKRFAEREGYTFEQVS